MSDYNATHRGSTPKLPGPLQLIREGIEHSPGSLNWYSDAGVGCARWAEDHGINPLHVIGALAITSPRVSVKANVQLCKRYLGGEESPAHAPDPTAGMMPSTIAALAYWESRGRDNRAIRGDKTRNFALAIAGDRSAVVLDVWAIRGLGKGGQNVTSRRYREWANTIARLAGRVSVQLGIEVAPRDAQAALWYGVRRRYGRTGEVSRIKF